MVALDAAAKAGLSDLFPDVKADDIRRELKETPFPQGAGDVIGQSALCLSKAEQTQKNAERLYAAVVLERAEALRSPGLRALLAQGKDEPFIAKVLAAADAPALAA